MNYQSLCRNGIGSILSTARKAGPVIEVDDSKRSVASHDAVAAINPQSGDSCQPRACLLQPQFIESEMMSITVHPLTAKLGITIVRRIVTSEKSLPLDAIELHQITHDMAGHHHLATVILRHGSCRCAVSNHTLSVTLTHYPHHVVPSSCIHHITCCRGCSVNALHPEAVTVIRRAHAYVMAGCSRYTMPAHQLIQSAAVQHPSYTSRTIHHDLARSFEPVKHIERALAASHREENVRPVISPQIILVNEDNITALGSQPIPHGLQYSTIFLNHIRREPTVPPNQHDPSQFFIPPSSL